MKIINRRYQLLETDGDDHYGTYYLALDLAKQKEPVRVKLLNQDMQLQEMVRYFSDHFLQLAASEHENLIGSLRFDIVTTIDNKPTEDKLYFYVTSHYLTSELLTYHHLELEERLFVLMEVCYALQFLHFKGIAYRYLTFENILITRNDDGQLKVRLRDLVSLYGYLDQGRSEIEKCIQTLSPEVLLRELSTIVSDIYSLGVVAYFLINGIDCHQHAFERTRTYSNQLAWQRLIENATMHHPDERLQQIQHFIKEFIPLCPYPYTFKDKKSYERLNFNVQMVGRDRELNHVRHLIASRLQHMSGVSGVLISGESGQGKSRFIREVHYYQRIHGARGIILEIDKFTEGAHDNFATLILSLVRQYAIPKTLVDRFGSELVKIVPTLRELWQVQPSDPLAGEKEVLRLNNRIVNFLLELAQMMPLVLYFDNIEDFHDNEFSIFENLLSSNDSLGLFIVASFSGMSNSRQNALATYRQNGDYELLILESFGIEEAAQQLQQVLFMDKRPLQLATKIISEGSGNPRYIEEVVRSLFIRNYVYIHESRKWFISDEGYGYATLPHTLDDAVMGSVKQLDTMSQRILQAITVYGKPISKGHLSEIIKRDEASIEQLLSHLVELKILQVKVSDWGYTFDFYNRNLARTYYNKLTDHRKRLFHSRSAELLEKIYQEEGFHGELLVKHLIFAKQYLKAIEYAIQLGDRMNELSLFAQALEFYHQALKIFEYVDEPQLKGKLIQAIADIYYRTGESQQALNRYESLVALASSNNMTEVKVDSLLKIADIRITRKQLEDIEAFLNEIRELATSAHYRLGLLELTLIEFRYLVSLKAFEQAKVITESSLKIAESLQNSYYIGRLTNNLGIITLYNTDEGESGDLERDKGYRHFLTAANFLEQTPNCSDLSRAYNNLGVIALNRHMNLEKAREYFEKALKILAKHNVIEGKSIYLLNLGETYALEGDDQRAIRYYLEVEQLCEDTQNVEDLILVTMNLIESNIQLKNYKDAYRYIQKFERDLEPLANLSWDLDIKRFYYLCGVFYLRMRELMLAKAYFERVSKDYTFVNDSIGRYRYHLIYVVFDYLISERRLTGEVDLLRLDELQSKAENNLELRYYVDLLLDLALDLAAMDTTRFLPDLVKRIEALPPEECTETQRIKRIIVLACLDENSTTELFEEIIGLYFPVLNSENRLLLHMITSNAYVRRNDLFKSLQHHLDALDIVHELTMMLPINLRMGYVLSDALRMKIFENIQTIKLRMVEDSSRAFKLMNAHKIGVATATNLEMYFDIGDMDVVFDNESFKESILDSYSKRYQIHVEKADQLLQLFQRDQGYNLQLVIRYLTQLTLSQVGFVYAINENGEVEDVFKSENHLVPYEFEFLQKLYGDLDEGVLVEHKKRLYVERAMLPRKSLMFLPIYNTQPHDGIPHRRKYDIEDSSYKEVLGYLYLESDKLLNNINENTFATVKQLNNLLYVLLDTFKLKRAATVDKLTGVFLRKHIEAEFKKELAEAKQRQHELSVAMVDIDHFKNVNDTFGHRKGDEVLSKIGEILMHTVRHGDYIGRYGGEEFMIILPKTTAQDAFTVCEKIREHVKHSRLLGDDFPVTISIGLATFPAMAQTEEELVERADQALYESKNLGRDRTTHYNGKSALNNRRYDKLAGILSGNASNDARVLKAIVDMMNLISDPASRKVKVNSALGILLDITEGQEATLILGDKTDYDILERHRGDVRLKMKSRMSKIILEGFLHTHPDDFFIHWNDIEDVDRATGIPNWKSYIVCPLHIKGESLGLVVVRVPIKEKEFEFKHYNFVKQLSSVIATLLT